MKLTAKQNQFCHEYMIDLNATQAAIRAGYSEKTAKLIGSENLTKPYIMLKLRKLLEEREKWAVIDADWVLGGIKSLTDELRESQTPKDAYKGYELGARHLKLLVDRVEQDIKAEVATVERSIID